MIYNPECFILLIGGVEVDGFSDGAAIKIQRAVEVYKLKSGIKGDVVEIKNPNKTGTMKLSIFSTSPTNQAFSALLIADENVTNGTKRLPILLRHTNGPTAVTAMARISKWPELQVDADEKAIEWEFSLTDLRINIAGVKD